MKSRIFVIALALIFVFAVLPCNADKPGWAGPKAEKNVKPGDVFQYEFGTAYMNTTEIYLCWDVAEEPPEGLILTEDAEKFSIAIFGPLYYGYWLNGVLVEEMADEWEYCYSYIPGETDVVPYCLSIDLSLIQGVLYDLVFSFGTVEYYDFATVSAKVKGLDPHNDNKAKKRQDNTWSPVYTFGTPIEWSAP